MAGNDDGKSSLKKEEEEEGDGPRTPRYLAVARYMVAAVVAVLTGVVILMVIIVAARRPEKISLSVLQGYVPASSLWNSVGGGDREGIIPIGPTVRRSYITPVDHVYLGIFLRVDNPGGRADISCRSVTVRVLDMPNGGTNYTGTTEVVGNRTLREEPFDVKRKTSHTLKKWVYVDNSTVTAHIARTWGGRTSFPAMVKVDMVITDVGEHHPRHVGYSCGPVTVSVNVPSDNDQPVQCTSSEDGDEDEDDWLRG